MASTALSDPLLFDRADTIVCLDHHRARQTARVAGRTLRRVLSRAVLWNGNRETLRNLWPFGDPEHTIIGWTWRNVPRARRLFDEVEARPPHPDTLVVRLRGWREIERFLDTFVGSTSTRRLDQPVKSQRYDPGPCRPD